MMTDRIGGTPLVRLIRVRPLQIRATIPGEADLPLTRPIRGSGANANVAVRARHDGEVIRGAVSAVVGGVAELEERLRGPLPGGDALGVAREAHPAVVEGGLERDGLACRDVSPVGALDHLEGRGDLVDCDLLRPVALVAYVEGERRVAGGKGCGTTWVCS